MMIQECRGRHFVGMSHMGYVRQENQDVWCILESLQLFIVADGMGGRKGGKMAATLAVDEVRQAMAGVPMPTAVEQGIDALKQAVARANRRVWEMAVTQGLVGMGTTLAVLWLVGEQALCAHVGDSRIYCIRDHRVTLLTEDHTLFQEGRTSAQNKHVLSRAIGIGPSVEVTVHEVPYQAGDLFMVCTDGLTHAVSAEQIGALVEGEGSLEGKAQKLVETALQAGGRDNITLILVQ